MAEPERAIPTWQQKAYSIRETVFNSQPAVVIYNGVVPKEDCVADRIFVVANPYDGLYSFPLQKDLAKTVSAVPADTGKTMNTSPPAHGTKFITSEGKSTGVETTGNPLTKPIKNSIKSVGWNPEDHVGILVPLAVKIFNPELKEIDFFSFKLSSSVLISQVCQSQSLLR